MARLTTKTTCPLGVFVVKRSGRAATVATEKLRLLLVSLTASVAKIANSAASLAVVRLLIQV
jgi:hypothetical protein